MQPHMRFWRERSARESPFQQRRSGTGRYAYSCPGCGPHLETRRHKPLRMFDRWLNRQRDVWPQKAFSLYWRTHAAELAWKTKVR